MAPGQDKRLGARAVRAGLGYTVGNILVKGIAFLTLPLFARLMSTAQYGIYNTYAAYVSVLAVVVSLGLPSSVRNARYDLERQEGEYYSVSALMICLALGCFLMGAFFLRGPLEGWTRLSRWLVLIAVVNSGCTALHSYYNNILMADYSFKSFLKLSLFYSLTSILCSVALILSLFRQESALGRALGNMLPMVAIAGYVLVKIWRGSAPRFRAPLVRYGLAFGLPLIFSDLSAILLSQFDRMMIFSTVGEAQAGIYSFAYNVAVIYQAVTSSVEGAWTPWMFEQLYREERAMLGRRVRDYAVLLTVGTAFLLLGSPELVWLLSGGAYWESRTVVAPIVGGMYFFALGAVPVGIEFYHKKTQWISLCTVAATVLNIVLNLYCIPRYGYQAAAYTTLACYMCYALAHGAMAQRLAGWRLFFRWEIGGAVLGLLAVLGAAVALLERPGVRWGILAVLGAVCVGIAMRNREKLEEFVGAVLKRKS